jgi:hypothetical protein
MGKLNRCPWCKSSFPRLMRLRRNWQLLSRYHVECWNCGLNTRASLSQKQAIKTWNKTWR